MVIDLATGQNWEQSGSTKPVIFYGALIYVGVLNSLEYSGYADWRLPSLQEAISLMEPKMYRKLHISSVFDQRQSCILTATIESHDKLWTVDFKNGCCCTCDIDNVLAKDAYVRAIR
ncbi:MAG: DUF1566 domain-containing protein [bacterium]